MLVLPASALATRVEIVGARQIPPGQVASLLEVPDERVDLQLYAAMAEVTVAAYYMLRGYDLVRVESLYRPESDTLVVWIDEGQMARIVFSGASVVDALLYRVDLHLPGNVYQRDLVAATAAELKAKYGLAMVTPHVEELPTMMRTPVDTWVPERELVFEIEHHESTGWGFGFALDGTFGIIPRIRVKSRDLFFEQDRLRAQLGIGFPYRRLLTQQDAQAQWTYGRLELDYRFPPFAGSQLATELETEVLFARHARADIEITDYYALRVSELASLDLILGAVDLTAGVGIDYSSHYDARDLRRTVDNDVVRGVGRVGLELVPDARVRREDEALFVELDVRLSGNADDGAQLGLFLQGQGVVDFQPMRFIARGRAFWLTGDVRFWEEIPLSGSYLRTFFGRYARDAVQLDTQLRVAVSRMFELGVFYDITGYIDRSRPELPFVPAQAFGPSFHAFLFDTILIDVAYAFGFDPAFDVATFDHNFYLSASSVF